MSDPTERFSNRVEAYDRYRPSYPPALLEILSDACDLSPATIIADVGSGTGKLAELFLENGNRVFGVEPNRAMRAAAEAALRSYPRFTSIPGRAEATTLADRCADMITVGQAFHWFDAGKTREEFLRILRPVGWVVLVWNIRRTAATPFMEAYERLVETHSIGCVFGGHTRADETIIAAFFGSAGFALGNLEHRQVLDLESLEGRLVSSSYLPAPGHPGHEPLLRDLRSLFEAYQENRRVRLEYETEVYFGQLEAEGAHIP